ncbi:MAG: Na+/H+ antiporter NhaA [Novosphingobium sp.]
MPVRNHTANRLSTAATQLLGGEAGAGVLLIVVAAVALALANSPLAGAWHHLLHGTLRWTPLAKLDTLHLWINDALMAVFFFTIGLEIKREFLHGQLSTPPRRRLPILAAAAGMIAPALIYLAVAGGGGLARGWAIPAATDIAFALGVLALLGSRAPPSLRLFLLTVAIVDDLGAVAIIALFYTSGIALTWLAAAVGVFVAMLLLGLLRVRAALPFLLLAVALWYCVLNSGVHATVAGVLAALAIPLRPGRHGDSLLLRLEHALTPWSAYLIVPLFGLANAGVGLGAQGGEAGPAGLFSPLPLAVALGLFLGKQAGILGAIALSRATAFAAPPQGASWMQLWGVSILCGIGFTMSLFIAALAFPAHPDLAEAAKLGILAGSLLSALLGYLVLRLAGRR